MSVRDRYPSYLIEAFNNIHHYVNYRGRSYQDLAILQDSVDELKLMINTRLIRDFSQIPEVAEMLKIKH